MSLKPFYGVYLLVSQPFRQPELGSSSVGQKLVVAGRNCYRAAAKELEGTQGAWVYPFLGIYCFFAVPDLHTLLLGSVASGVVVSAAVTVAMFVLAWAPQFALLSFLISPFLAFPVATFLVLAESWYFSYTIAKLTWMENMQERVFDTVIRREACKKGTRGVLFKDLVNAANKKPNKPASFLAGRLVSRLRNYPRAVFDDMVEYIVTLPLNLIPGLGNALFVYINAEALAMKYHARYFDLKGWKQDPLKIRRFVEEREPAYRAFGIVSMLLNIVPVLNVFFALTNTAGAALWACDIERRSSARMTTGQNS